MVLTTLERMAKNGRSSSISSANYSRNVENCILCNFIGSMKFLTVSYDKNPVATWAGSGHETTGRAVGARTKAVDQTVSESKQLACTKQAGYARLMHRPASSSTSL